MQVHTKPKNIFVLVLDHGVFDYENEDDDEDELVVAPAAPGPSVVKKLLDSSPTR